MKNRKGVEYQTKFMRMMKKKKRKKIRSIKLNEAIKEQFYNDASMNL